LALEEVLSNMQRNWPEAVDPQSVCILKAQRLAALVQEGARQALVPFRLSFTEFEMLCALRSQPAPHEVLPTALYDALLISSGGLTKVLKALEARGLVARPPRSGDRRRRPVTLTEEGRAVVEQAMAAVQWLDAERLGASGLAAGDYAALGRLLGVALEAMERDLPQPARASLRSR
jgi:DNA-binding MarR family transcriptional regulator